MRITNLTATAVEIVDHNNQHPKIIKAFLSENADDFKSQVEQFLRSKYGEKYKNHPDHFEWNLVDSASVGIEFQLSRN